MRKATQINLRIIVLLLLLRKRPASHLPNSSIKDDDVRVFLSGRDRPYSQGFHAPTKLLVQTVQSLGRPEIPET